MKHDAPIHDDRNPKGFLRLENGRVYFSRDAERKFYFVLSMIILLVGLLYKMGVLQ